MSDYTDSVLGKFTDAPASVRKALAAALAAAEKAQQAKPGSAPIGESSLQPTGAMASEGDPGDAVSELLRLAEDIHRRSPHISLEEAARVALYGDHGADLRERHRVRLADRFVLVEADTLAVVERRAERLRVEVGVLRHAAGEELRAAARAVAEEANPLSRELRGLEVEQ